VKKKRMNAKERDDKRRRHSSENKTKPNYIRLQSTGMMGFSTCGELGPQSTAELR
jgi:hypothetical protein